MRAETPNRESDPLSVFQFIKILFCMAARACGLSHASRRDHHREPAVDGQELTAAGASLKRLHVLSREFPALIYHITVSKKQVSCRRIPLIERSVRQDLSAVSALPYKDKLFQIPDQDALISFADPLLYSCAAHAAADRRERDIESRFFFLCQRVHDPGCLFHNDMGDPASLRGP